jgi:hypothetical protein
MNADVVVRTLTDDERSRLLLEAGLPNQDPDIRQRCQIILGSSRGESMPQLASILGCEENTARDIIQGFNKTGIDGWFDAIVPVHKPAYPNSYVRRPRNHGATEFPTRIQDWTVWTDTPEELESDDGPKVRYTRIWAPYRKLDRFFFSVHRSNFLDRILAMAQQERFCTNDPVFNRTFSVSCNSIERVTTLFANPRVRSLTQCIGKGRLETIHPSDGHFRDLPPGMGALFYELKDWISDQEQTVGLRDLIAEMLDELHRMGSAAPENPTPES